jgi:hypothetical protein
MWQQLTMMRMPKSQFQLVPASRKMWQQLTLMIMPKSQFHIALAE